MVPSNERLQRIVKGHFVGIVWIAWYACKSFYSCPACFIARCSDNIVKGNDTASDFPSESTKVVVHDGTRHQDWCFRCLMDCVVAIIIRLRCILSFTQIYRQFLVDQRIPHKYRFNAPVLLCIYISYLISTHILSTLIPYYLFQY